MNIIALVVTVALLTVAGPALAGEVYWWVDENGVRRFSDQPPENPEFEVHRSEAIPYDKAEDQKRTDVDFANQRQRLGEQRERQAAAEAEAQKVRERKQAERARLEEQKREEEAQRKAALEERRKYKSAAKKARTRPPKASPNPD